MDLLIAIYILVCALGYVAESVVKSNAYLTRKLNNDNGISTEEVQARNWTWS